MCLRLPVRAHREVSLRQRQLEFRVEAVEDTRTQMLFASTVRFQALYECRQWRHCLGCLTGVTCGNTHASMSSGLCRMDAWGLPCSRCIHTACTPASMHGQSGAEGSGV